MRYAIPLLGAALLMTGCQNDSDSSMHKGDKTSMSAKAGSLSESDMKFVKNAASGGMYEVQSSQLALNQNVDATTKKLAQQMIKDHTAAGSELAMLAKSKGTQVPSALLPKHQELIDELNGLSGKQFQDKYRSQQLAAHDETIALFEKEVKNSDDADLKAFATKTLPTLQHHRAMLQSNSSMAM